MERTDWFLLDYFFFPATFQGPMESNRLYWLWPASPAASSRACPWGQEPHFSSTRDCLNYITGVPVSSLFLNCCLDFLDWLRTCLVTLINTILDCWRELLLSPSYSLIWLKFYGMGQALPGLCWCQPQLPAPFFQGETLATPSCKWWSFSNFQRCFKLLKITKEKKRRRRSERVNCVSSISINWRIKMLTADFPVDR